MVTARIDRSVFAVYLGGREMNKGRLLSMVLSALLVIFGFASTKAQTGIENVRWELNELNGRKAANSRIYLEFDGSTGRISGSGGCNRFFGSYELKKTRFKAFGVGTTKMACMRPGTMETEVDFLNALKKADRIKQERATLSLFSGKKRVLVFRKSRSIEREPVTVDLSSRKWILKNIGGIDVDLGENAAFLNFDPAKGTSGGNTGCNVFGGNYEALGSKIKFSQMVSTMRACEFENRMTIERQFLDGLQKADRYEVREGRLLLYAGKKVLLEFMGIAK